MIRTIPEMKTEVRERMRGGAGAVTIRHMFEPAEFGAPVRLCARLTLPPGAGIGPHAHATEDEVYVVLSGHGLLHDGTAERRIGPGDAVLTGHGGSHAVRNDGDTDLEILAFIATYPAKA
jgi:mannose-6-phosphate isomerase-like protein (cupin superfamily)